MINWKVTFIISIVIKSLNKLWITCITMMISIGFKEIMIFLIKSIICKHIYVHIHVYLCVCACVCVRMSIMCYHQRKSKRKQNHFPKKISINIININYCNRFHSIQSLLKYHLNEWMNEWIEVIVSLFPFPPHRSLIIFQ